MDHCAANTVYLHCLHHGRQSTVHMLCRAAKVTTILSTTTTVTASMPILSFPFNVFVHFDLCNEYILLSIWLNKKFNAFLGAQKQTKIYYLLLKFPSTSWCMSLNWVLWNKFENGNLKWQRISIESWKCLNVNDWKKLNGQKHTPHINMKIKMAISLLCIRMKGP